MGQRLTIDIYKKEEEKPIACLYFHWSAYTTSALMEINNIIDLFFDEKYIHISDEKLRLIRIVENIGGGIDGGKHSHEWDYIKKLYPDESFKENNIDRSYGLIALSEEGIAQMNKWSEGPADIRLGDTLEDTIASSCVYWLETKEDLKECYEITEEEFNEKVIELPEGFNLENIPAEDLPLVIKFFEENEEMYIKINNNEFINCIR